MIHESHVDSYRPLEGPDARMSRILIDSIAAEYARYKALGEGAFAQLEEAELSHSGADESNSITAIVWHLAGNLKSRFTDFRTTDGEKAWRHRDEEFAQRIVSRQQLLDQWEDGWHTLFMALDALTDEDLHQTITIRRQSLTIHQALHRSLAHASYHVGQIIYVAKSIRGVAWHTLSIARGESEAYNTAPDRELPGTSRLRSS
jgi:hypothetical protein